MMKKTKMRNFKVVITFASQELVEHEFNVSAPTKNHAELIAGLEARKDGLTRPFKKIAAMEISK